MTLAHRELEEMMEGSAPTLQEIMKRADRRRDGDWQGFYKLCKKADMFYDGTYQIQTAEGGIEVRSATGHAQIESATDHIDVKNMSMETPLPGPRGQHRAGVLTKFDIGNWHKLEMDKPVRRMLVKDMFRYGVSWSKAMFDPDRWPERPKLDPKSPEWRDEMKKFLAKRKIRHPLSCDVVNPKNMVVDLATTGMSWAVQFYNLSKDDATSRFPDLSSTIHGVITDAGGGDPDKLHDFFEYWDDTWTVYIFAGKKIGEWKHNYGYLPFIEGNAGYGEVDSPDPSKRWRGLLHNIYDLLLLEARILSQYESILAQSAWPGHAIQGPEELVAKVQDNWPPQPGQTVHIPPGVNLVEVRPIVPPQEILRLHQVIIAKIEEDTAPSVARGANVPAAASGYRVAVQAGIAKLKFGPVADGLGRSIEKLNAVYRSIVENVIQEPITVWARTEANEFEQTLKPSDIKGYHVSVVKAEATAPEDADRRANLGINLFQAGLSSWYHIVRDYIGYKNPLEIYTQRQAELTLEQPEIQQAIRQKTMEKHGTGVLLSPEVAGGGGGEGGAELGFNQMFGQVNQGNMFSASQAGQQKPEAVRGRGSRNPNIKPGNFADMQNIASQIAQAGGSPQRVVGGEV